MWLTFNKRTRKGGVFNHLFRLSHDLFLGRIMIRLRDVDMDKFKTGINGALTIFHAWTMVEVDVHFNAIFSLVVVDHITNILKPKSLNLAVTHFHQYRCLQLLRCATNRD
ncbi:hypothetical protein D3C87_1316850 [compost metagenome]